MGSTGNIEHSGVITSIEGDRIRVNFISRSACSECHAKSSCTASEMQEKTIEVFNHSGSYKVGDNVSVVMSPNLGYKAIILGYLLPFAVLLLVIIVMQMLTGNELVSGVTALASLVPYYILLSLFNKALHRTFNFQLEKRSPIND
jgi:sigma-E factor negative regulatory protein RseC